MNFFFFYIYIFGIFIFWLADCATTTPESDDMEQLRGGTTEHVLIQRWKSCPTGWISLVMEERMQTKTSIRVTELMKDW